MPTCGHAVVIRARWFSPTAPLTFLRIIDSKKSLNAAGSHHSVLLKITRRQLAITRLPENFLGIKDADLRACGCEKSEMVGSRPSADSLTY
ncbi:hypothetical protein [Ignatzschineria indica]|uniref:hypothetical protein n=1 Tax=Ignatzschineria indica TaxID=472583 RepID=UPI0010580934|nr:hypothetical protein [Ignatzschineria indica]